MERIHYLTGEEKLCTRGLWEKIFPEDSRGFLDYYYKVKTGNNEILVVEEEGEIRAMLQLNPYRIRLGETEAEAAYVVAVATDVPHRHQGMMGRLLKRAMEDRRKKEQPFLFLMPVSEALYRPYGFRFVYRQGILTTEFSGVENTPARRQTGIESGWHLCSVSDEELEEAAVFAERILDREDRKGQEGDVPCSVQPVRTIRDAEYYQTLQAECQSEDGELSWIVRDGERQGLLSYTLGETIEVREPLAEDTKVLCEALEHCFAVFHRPLYVYGISKSMPLGKGWRREPDKPVIMARALNLAVLTGGIRAQEETEFSLLLEDPILSANCGHFVWKVGPDHSDFVKVAEKNENRPASPQGLGEIILPVETFMELLFGTKRVEQVRLDLPGHAGDCLAEKWKKLYTYGNVRLNEIV